MKKALILGITSQDGLLLAKYLLEHGYSIVGTTRGLNARTSALLTKLNLINLVDIVQIDLTNVTQVRELLKSNKFNEIYNLSAQSSVARSFKDPVSTFSSIIDRIQERDYVKRENVTGKKMKCTNFELNDDEIVEKVEEREFGNEKNKLVIQPIGTLVIEFLIKHFDMFMAINKFNE